MLQRVRESFRRTAQPDEPVPHVRHVFYRIASVSSETRGPAIVVYMFRLGVRGQYYRAGLVAPVIGVPHTGLKRGRGHLSIAPSRHVVLRIETLSPLLFTQMKGNFARERSL